MTPFYRFRILLRATCDLHLPPQQGAVVYALICAANQAEAQQQGLPKSFPSSLMTDVPEVGRSIIDGGSSFSFGGTLLGSYQEEVRATLDHLTERLQQLGIQGKPRPKGLGGNFEVVEVRDLVSGFVRKNQPLTAIPDQHLDQNIQELLQLEELTIDFQSPIRIERPRKHHDGERIFFDEQFFNVHMLARMLMKRMSSIGIALRDSQQQAVMTEQKLQLLNKSIVWMDLTYIGKTDVHIEFDISGSTTDHTDMLAQSFGAEFGHSPPRQRFPPEVLGFST